MKPKRVNLNGVQSLRRIQISGKFGVSGSVNLISESGFVVFGYPDFRYPSRYSIIRGYPDPDPDP
ncbi:hypothetical protein F2Q69_00020100 [Brassica cretica]|uniref:Uncharacterized protein n=1 Tax=Brassica cretica TaxID=69181 RepID=A0A8S9Q018_BRACR|nr:hypothetical protein F2Q69_00020100 [Brassica cretica]